MIAAFFNKSSCIIIIPLEDCRIDNALWCTTICWPDAINKGGKNTKCYIILHQDNAALLTMDYLKHEKIELMTYCSYSPDLAPND